MKRAEKEKKEAAAPRKSRGAEGSGASTPVPQAPPKLPPCACCRRMEPKSMMARCKNCSFSVHAGEFISGAIVTAVCSWDGQDAMALHRKIWARSGNASYAPTSSWRRTIWYVPGALCLRCSGLYRLTLAGTSLPALPHGHVCAESQNPSETTPRGLRHTLSAQADGRKTMGSRAVLGLDPRGDLYQPRDIQDGRRRHHDSEGAMGERESIVLDRVHECRWWGTIPD